MPRALNTSAPLFLNPIAQQLPEDDQGRYKAVNTIDTDQKRIFVQNAEQHTHGFCNPRFRHGVIATV
ncbi:hypothetical protein ACOBV8_18535 (plasmid) [Pseudoalteromonas espejiana]